MASMPLPALNVQPMSAPPNMIQQYGNLMQLRNMMQEEPIRQQIMQQQAQAGDMANKQQQIALNDQKAMTDAMRQWDGKDINDLPPLVIKSGGSSTAVMGLRKSILDQQAQVSTIAKNNGDAALAQINAATKRNDLITGALSPLVDPSQVPDAQLPQALTSTVTSLVQQGLLDQPHAQAAEKLGQSGDPTAIRQGIDGFRKTLMANSQIMDAGLKQAQTGEANARTREANTGTDAALLKQYAPTLAQSANQGEYTNKLQALETLHPEIAGRFPQQFNPKNPQSVLSVGMSAPELADYNQKNSLAQFHEAQENYRAQLGRATTFENARMQHGLTQIDSLTADPQRGYGQFATEAQAVKAAVTSAKDGSQLAASLEPMMLSLGVSGFAGVHRINEVEIKQAGSAVGSVYRKMNNLLSNLGSGKPTDAQLNEATSLIDQLQTARHNSYIQGVTAVAGNSRLDPSQLSVFDRDGNVAPLSSFSNPPGSAQGGAAHAARPTQAAGGMVTVQIPGMAPGKIPASAVAKFRQEHPNAKVTQ